MFVIFHIGYLEKIIKRYQKQQIIKNLQQLFQEKKQLKVFEL